MLFRMIMNEFNDVDLTIPWMRKSAGDIPYPYTLIPIKYLIVEEFYA